MKGFKDQPIARKAFVLGFVPTLCAVVLVALLSMLATYLQARTTLLEDLETESAIVAENVSAALSFNDKEGAADALVAFRNKNNIEAVCVFDVKGQLFASFVQASGACPAQQGASIAARTSPLYDHPVMSGARQVGVVRLIGNFSRLYAWMRRQVLVAFGTLIAGVVLALALTRQLGRAITVPVLNLASTADRVSTSGDYTMRAKQTTDDELGHLAQSFNVMLAHIQQQHEATSTLLEREQEASRLKDQFLAAVSHELRTPLNAILGWVQIIRTTKPDAQTMARALESLERNAHAQARVIEDLIELSRVVTGKLRLKTEVVDVRTVVKAALEVVNPAMSAKAVRLSVTVPGTPTLVSGDAERLQQVVWNLFSNAIKFTPSGGTVTVELKEFGSEYVLTVEDTGIGISAEFLPFVFDRFRQADGTLTREHGGLGLGLAIVKDLTELHGGTVLATSPGKGRGASFSVRLPRLAGADRLLRSSERESVEGSPAEDALAGVRVLAVDDDPDALEVITEGLTSLGANVRVADSGTEAISMWSRERFDVLVCDLSMPRVDGFAVLRAISERAHSFDNGALAIALTAHASEDDRQRSIDAGFHHHLGKPYELNELVQTILSGLHARHAEGA